MKRLLCALMLCITASLYAAEQTERTKRKEHPHEEKERQPKKLQSLPASPPLAAVPIDFAPANPPAPIFPPLLSFLIDRAQMNAAHALFTSLIADMEQLKQCVAALENRNPLETPAFDHTALGKRLDSLAGSIASLQKNKNTQKAALETLLSSHDDSIKKQKSDRKRIKTLEEQLESLVRKTNADATRIESVEKTVADARHETETRNPEILKQPAPAFQVSDALKGQDIALPMSPELPLDEGNYE